MEGPGAGEGARPQDVLEVGSLEAPDGNGEAPPLQAPADHHAKWVDLTRLPPEPTPREWILPGFIPAGRVTLLYGLGGVGKTIFALHLAVCLATNRPFLGRKLARNVRPVIYLCEDDLPEAHRRLDAICRGLGLDFHQDVAPRLWFVSQADEQHKLLIKVERSRSNVYLDDRSVSTDDVTVYATEIAHDLRAVIMSDGELPFFIIDPLVKTHDGDENNRSLADQILMCLERILCFDPLTGKRDRSSALVLAHPSKRSQTSGTNAWPNASRSTMLMGPEWFLDERPPDKKDPLQVALFKANYASPDIRETIEMIEEGQSTYVRWIDQRSIEAQQTNQALVIEIITSLTANGRNLSPKPKAPNHIVKEILNHRLNSRSGRRVVTKEQIENLVDKLRDAGTLAIEDYKTTGRTWTTRLRLADVPAD